MKALVVTKITKYKINILPNDHIPRVGERIVVGEQSFQVTNVVHQYYADPEWRRKFGVDNYYLDEIRILVK